MSTLTVEADRALDPLADARATGPLERLLEESWETRSRRASRRELLVEGSAAVLFLALSVPLASAALAQRHTDLPMAALLVVLYAIVARTARFPIGAGYFVPSYLVLVPMLLLLPPLAVPLLAAGGLVLGSCGRLVARRGTPQEMLFSIPDAWHAFGPALVLELAPRAHGVAHMGVYLAAFIAGCLFDLVGSSLRETLILGVAPKLQLRVIATIWMVDACIAPVGLLLADAARRDAWQLLLVLPLNALLVLADRDRSRRIAEAQRRLAVVDRQRSRLQAAVHRLGEAFAAKLDLGALTDVLLNGSIDALDAGAGHIRLAVRSTRPIVTTSGSLEFEPLLSRICAQTQTADATVVSSTDSSYALAIPFRLGADGGGALAVARCDRAFSDDERGLLERLVQRAESAAAEIVAHELLREQVNTDPLTRLGNRRKLTEVLAEQLAEGALSTPAVLMLFDLDGFKAYNDSFGHLAGDALLARLGRRLEAAVGPRGLAFRLGGDEFCVLLAADEHLHQTAGAAIAALDERRDEFTITASCGSVLLPHEATGVDYALQLADERMYSQKHARRSGAGEQVHDVLIHILHAKRNGLEDHSSGVTRLALRVGRRLGMDPEELDELARAATLHDIGKVGIPDAILNKPGPLDDREWAFMRRHTILGDRILSAAPALRPVAVVVRASHERWDGGGYPDGLQGEQIPLAARIVAVCDAYDAMVTDRCYRAARMPVSARAELLREGGRQFDPAIVATFLEELEREEREEREERDVREVTAGSAGSQGPKPDGRITEIVGRVRELLTTPA